MGYILTVIGLIIAVVIGLFIKGPREREPPESIDLEMQKERIRIFPRGPG